MINLSDKLVKRGFGGKVGWGSRPCLVIIDMTEAFTSPSVSLGNNLDNEIRKIIKIARVFEKKNLPIFWFKINYTEDELTNILWAKKQKGLEDLLVGSEGENFDIRLSGLRKDSVIIKKYASCFHKTNFLKYLRQNDIDTLVLVGTSTSGCVRATAVDAIQNEFHCIVVEDAVGDRDKNAHDQALIDIYSRYADVENSEQVVEMLIGMSAEI